MKPMALILKVMSLALASKVVLLASPEYYPNRAALAKRLWRDVRCGNATTLACEERTSEWFLTSTNGVRRRRLSFCPSVRLVQQASSTRHTYPDVLSWLTDRSRDQSSPTIGEMHFGASGADCKCPIRLVPFRSPDRVFVWKTVESTSDVMWHQKSWLMLSASISFSGVPLKQYKLQLADLGGCRSVYVELPLRVQSRCVRAMGGR